MKSLILAALVVVITAPAEAGPKDSPKGLIAKWHDANGRCRGGSGNDDRTYAACEEREGFSKALGILGWCYGRPEQYGYQMKWERCTALTNPPSR